MAFKNFKGFLNERVVLEIIFIERHWRAFLWLQAVARGGDDGSGALARRLLLHWLRAFAGEAGLTISARFGRRFRQHKLYLAIGMAQFRQPGLQQCMVSRVVHQAEMIFKFRIEPDDQKIISE